MTRIQQSQHAHDPATTLNGWWIARVAWLGGVHLPSDVLPALGIVLFKRTFYLGNDIGTFDVDRTLMPATIDVLITRGPNRWRFIPGIFQQHNRVLRLCLELSGVSRPPDFRSPSGSRLLLVTYERAPAREPPRVDFLAATR